MTNIHYDNVVQHMDTTSIHDIHKGERLFIMGTGPSLWLTESYLDRLAKEYTFGVNLLLKWKPLTFTPTYYMLAEMRHWYGMGIDHNADMILSDRLPLPEVRFYNHPEPMDIPGWVHIKLDLDLRMQDGEVFKGLGGELEPTAWGNSVVMSAVQVGCWMGFQEIILLGCDATLDGHAYEMSNDPRRLRQDSFQRSALTAQQHMEAAGRKFLNASGHTSTLPIPKVDLKDLLRVQS